jgi:DNA polymerase elongation subunit (family B)
MVAAFADGKKRLCYLTETSDPFNEDGMPVRIWDEVKRRWSTITKLSRRDVLKLLGKSSEAPAGMPTLGNPEAWKRKVQDFGYPRPFARNR